MLKIFKFIVWCYLLHFNYAARHPVSPCPNVFSYEGEPENDRWYGVINFSSNIELAGLNYKVQLDRPSELLVSWDGEVRSDDNTLYNVFNPYHEQKPGEMVKARIMVKFNTEYEPPKIAKIIINGNTMCSVLEGNLNGGHSSGIGLSGDFPSSTERFDPSFNENEDIQSEFNNNRAPQNNGNFGTNPNYGNSNSYGNSRPSNIPNYGNSNQNFGNSNVPSYGNTGTNTNYGNSNGGTYGNPVPSIYNPSEVNFPSNQPVSNFGGNRPQWPDNSPVNSQNSGGTNTGFPSNSYSSQAVDGGSHLGNSQNVGPNSGVVTTLTLPNNNQNKTSYEQILQIIKNQLDQQPFNANVNKTVIVAVVNTAVTTNPGISHYSAPSNNIVLVTPEQPQQQPKTASTSTSISSTQSSSTTTAGKTRNTATTNTKSFSNNRN